MNSDTTLSDKHPLLRKVAIIGAGTMGLGVAEYFAVAGLEVIITDMTPELSRQISGRLMQRVRGHVEAGLLGEEAIDRAKTVQTADDIASAVRDVDLVFEAVPERIDIKRDVLMACEVAARPDAIIVSNTSSLPIDDLAVFVERKDRFLGMHWFNPPEWTPGVEVIPSDVTDPEIVEQIKTFLLAIGKRPAVIGSGPGFVANRLQFALFREALAIVEDGLATPEELDEVVKSCFGFRLPFFGPFQIADMAGLDVYASIFPVLEQSLGEDWHIPDALKEIVESGKHGTKTGEGFYQYSDEEREKLLIERDSRYAALNDLLKQYPPLTPNPNTEDDS
jgi:3-hydroxybutyryl-CoA dehydrogenase